MTARFVTAKVLGALATLAFVVCFNFFLFRVVEGDPVANLFRGRNLSAEQRDELAKDFGIDKLRRRSSSCRYLGQTAQLNFGCSYTTTSRSATEIGEKAWPTISLVGISTLLSTVSGSCRHRGGVAPRTKHATRVTSSDGDVRDAGLLARHVAARRVRGRRSAGSPRAASSIPAPSGGLAQLVDQAHHMFLPGLTLTLAYLGEYALVTRTSVLETMGEDYLALARAKGLRDSLVRNRHAVPNALLPVSTLAAINFGFVLSGAIAVESIFSWPGLGLLTFDALRGPDLPMLQGLFLFFSAAVILANLSPTCSMRSSTAGANRMSAR